MTTRLAWILLTTVVAGCSLDASEKPVCVVDDDCGGSRHCSAEVCVDDIGPQTRPDVIFVPTGATHVEGDVLANDMDPDDPLVVKSVGAGESSSGQPAIQLTPSGTVALDVPPSLDHAAYLYRLVSGGDATPITVARLPAELVIPVVVGTTVDVFPYLARIRGLEAADIDVTTAPMVGHLTAAGVAQTYSAGPACGDDAATYRLHAANGDFALPVRFQVGVPLVGEARSVPFGRAQTLDVLANDPDPTLELVATSAAYATISADHRTLIVHPPAVTASPTEITYTARNAAGCLGTATVALEVHYQTDVVVGPGLTGGASEPSISADSRYIAFTSGDASLVPGDTNAAADVFVLDLATDLVERVSVDSTGAEANGASGSPSISADGRYIAFTSRATNLAAADTTAIDDVYLHDRTTGTTVLVSESVDHTGSDGPCANPQLSDDGDRVVYASAATRLVDADTNSTADIFLRDRTAVTTTRVSLREDGTEAYGFGTQPRLSGDGRYVVLTSSAALDSTHLAGVFLVDTYAVGVVTRLDYGSGTVDIDRTGRHVAYASGTYVTTLDRQTGDTDTLSSGDKVSLSGAGTLATFTGVGTLSGHVYAALEDHARVDVLLDPQGDVALTPIQGRPVISRDGRWIVMATSAWPGYENRLVILRVWNRARPTMTRELP